MPRGISCGRGTYSANGVVWRDREASICRELPLSVARLGKATLGRWAVAHPCARVVYSEAVGLPGTSMIEKGDLGAARPSVSLAAVDDRWRARTDNVDDVEQDFHGGGVAKRRLFRFVHFGLRAR